MFTLVYQLAWVNLKGGCYNVNDKVSKLLQEEAQALSKYMKGEIRAQRILIESIKDPLIPYVEKLETSNISKKNY